MFKRLLVIFKRLAYSFYNLCFWLMHQILVPLSIFHRLETVFTKASLMDNTLLKYLIIFLGIVEVWGIKIGPVIAGLGLFGVAVALGAQDLFKNLISGIMILLESVSYW